MKVVLINPPVNLDKTLGKFKSVSEASLHLGLGYLAGTLKRHDIDVHVLDAYAENIDVKETVSRIGAICPDIVGISCVTPNAIYSHEIIKKIKEAKSSIITVLGGVHPSLMTEETMVNNDVNIVVRQEGEEIFFNVVKALETKNDLKDISGISYRSNGEVLHNPIADFIQDLDALPFPAWDLFKLELYKPLPHWGLTSWEKPIFPLLTSRGCPFSCTYCSVKTLGKKVRVRSPENVVDEIEMMMYRFGAEQFIFWDAIFPLNKKKGMELTGEIIRRNLSGRIAWECETRVDVVDDELLESLREAGCKRIMYGIESGVQELLGNIRKKISLEKIRNAVRLTQKHGIEIMANFMLGLPGEDISMSKKTIAFAKELNADYAKFNLTIPYPGTEMYRQATEEGTIKSLDWSKYSSLNALSSIDPVYVPKGMTKEELVQIQKTAIRSYYLRPVMVWKFLKKVRTFQDVKRYAVVLILILKTTVFVKR